MTFLAPTALLALLALPVIWLLLRATPPAPRTETFPPSVLMRDLEDPEQTPERTPWWLLALRMTLLAMLALALARPVWVAGSVERSDAPLILVLDDGWTSAPRWTEMIETADSLLAPLRDSHPVALALSATPPAATDERLWLDALEARQRLASLEPQPWRPDRAALAERLEAVIEAAPAPARGAWISDGLDHGGEPALFETLARLESLSVRAPETVSGLVMAAAAGLGPEGVRVTLMRPEGAGRWSAPLAARALDGRLLARGEAVFEPGQTLVETIVPAPLEIANEAALVQVIGASSAGGVRLFDDADRRPLVGLVDTGAGQAAPLLSEMRYLAKALEPSSTVISGDVDSLLARQPAALVMADTGRLPGDLTGRLRAWIEGGGVLIRFAGPRLAQQGDELLPAPLRRGDRTLGGALRWDEPQPLAPFGPESPFAGVRTPTDVTVRRQVLAEPSPDLSRATWARLADGSPVVTGARLGEGWLALFHVTAGPDWSDLPLSGVYVEMLERLARMGPRTAAAAVLADQPFRIRRALDGLGRLQEPGARAETIAPEAWEDARVSQAHPPGLYEAGGVARALNAFDPDDAPAATRVWPANGQLIKGARREAASLAPWLLLAAAALFLADMLASLHLAGRTPRRRGAAAASAALVVAPLALTLLSGAVWLGAAPQALAQTPPAAAENASADGELDQLMAAANQLRLAYARTGDPRLDRMSAQGLEGLSRTLRIRTSIEPLEPVGLDIAVDPLNAYPFIYWPVPDDPLPLTDAEAARVNAYLKNGGVILFDTRDAGDPLKQLGMRDDNRLARMLRAVDAPALEPAPEDHVLTKAFYLLSNFPGRTRETSLWVEAPREAGDPSTRDGVSSVIIGDGDWAAAWAVDENGAPAAVVEGGARDQEYAMRFGVNLIMYVLTGNYKADQVHVEAILERLSQ